jgi:hypothetical protein
VIGSGRCGFGRSGEKDADSVAPREYSPGGISIVVDCFGRISLDSGRARCRNWLVFETVRDADAAGFVCHHLTLGGGASGGNPGGNSGASLRVNTKAVPLELLIVTDT